MLKAVDDAAVFTKIEKRLVDGETVYNIEGAWDEEFAKSFADERLKPFVPDRIRIVLDAKLFPRQIVYVKNVGDGPDDIFPLVTLDFEAPVLGGPVQDSEFAFTPPAGVFPQDLTQQYIQKLSPQPTPQPPPGAPGR